MREWGKGRGLLLVYCLLLHRPLSFFCDKLFIGMILDGLKLYRVMLMIFGLTYFGLILYFLY